MSREVLFILISATFYVEAVILETEFGAKYQAYCPKNHFVSDMTIQKGRTRDGKYDIRFKFNCEKFTKNREDKDDDTEHCVTKFRFGMPDSELLLDNHWKSCTCDEYLAGVKSYLHSTKHGHKRLVQWRCCYGNQKVMNLSSCYYTGMRYLRAPWDTELKTRRSKFPREAIHSLSISDNYVNARVCQWLVKGRDVASKDVKHWWNKCQGVKKIGIKEIYDKINGWANGDCTIPTGMSPFGWKESTNSLATENAIVYKEKKLYKKQQHMCRDGNYIYGLYKYPVNGPQGKDYIFLTKCHEITYTVCYCSWKQNCTKPEDRLTKSETNKTYYVAGWRSKWNEDLGRREVEVFCCKSDGLKMNYCNVTKNFTDADTRIVINRPRYKINAGQEPKVIDGEIIRDIDQWHINGSLIVRFNICRVNGSDSQCEEPCFSCLDVDPTGELCTATRRPQTASTLAYKTTTQRAKTKTTTTKSSEPIFDFAFLLDESGSLKQEGFDIEKNFLMEFAHQFQIEPGVTRVSMIRFSDSAHTEWDFNSFPHQTTNTVLDRIETFVWQAGRTHITKALEISIPIFELQARAYVNQVVFLLTDGRHNQGDPQPKIPAEVLRDMGVQIYVVAIGDGVDIGELTQITGDQSLVFETSFANLVGNAAAIKQSIVNNAVIV